MADQGESRTPSYQPGDPEAFAHNLAQLYEEYGRAVSAYVAPRETGEAAKLMPDEASDVVKTLSRVAESWLSDPNRAVEAQTALWSGFIELWSASMKKMMGEPVAPAIEPEAGDKRFQDPEWSRNLYFDLTKQIYLLTVKWAKHLVDDAEGLDEHTRHKAEFYVKQIGAAISPSNYLLTNPELLKETMQSNGENLVRGMRNFAKDIKAGHGELRISQSDPAGFEVGRNLATTPGKVIYQNDLIQLLQYDPATKDVLKRPTLIIPPWINKFYVLDLTQEKSFIRWMVEQGHTVFCISWVNPDARQARKSFEDYMREGIFAAIEAIDVATGESEVDAIGYCVGGTLLAVTLAYMGAIKDARVATATFLTTQVDFTYAGDLKVFVDEDQLKVLEENMHQKGYLEGKRMANAFNMLRANDLIWPYVVNNYLKGKAPLPFDLLYWNSDSTRMPAANHSFYLRKCYLENALSKGEMTIGGKRLALKDITVPVYNLATREDHIAPARSVFEGAKLFGGPMDYVLSGSGHIAGVVNPPAKAKYQYWTGGPPQGAFEDWVAAATEHKGSWWPHWHDWIVAKSAAKVPARVPGSGKLPVIEAAPGSYVKVKD